MDRRVGLGCSGVLEAVYSIRVSVLLRSNVAFRASSSSLSLKNKQGKIKQEVHRQETELRAGQN